MTSSPIVLGNRLNLSRCPHCSVDQPNLVMRAEVQTTDGERHNPRLWRFYGCGRCGGVVTAWGGAANQPAQQMFPLARDVDEALPDRARQFLLQAVETLHAPAGAVMLAASAVDAMLKNKGYKSGSLYSRIDKAAADHLITPEMALWAHEVRLDANDQRHADEEAELPTNVDAQRAVDFVEALREFLFVLPSRIKRGRQTTEQT